VSATKLSPADEPRVVVELHARRPWWKRKSNRRITVSRASLAIWLAELFRALGRRLLVAGKALAVLAMVAGAALAGRELIRHVIASPRFAVREVRVAHSAHVTTDEVRALAGVRPGDHLLAVDPDSVAARLTTHPWIGSARVRRELPSTLSIEVVERRAVGSALMGALYLLDEAGHPFKRATFEEADGLPVITGVTREQYAALRPATEAAFREALAVLAAYGRDAEGTAVTRPKLSEIHVDPHAGFTMVLLEGGGEVRLGRGHTEAKLERLDRIFAALGPRGPAALTTVFLDGPLADRVTVKLAPADSEPPAMGSERQRRSSSDANRPLR
jgi:cell division protein FtsQ